MGEIKEEILETVNKRQRVHMSVDGKKGLIGDWTDRTRKTDGGEK